VAKIAFARLLLCFWFLAWIGGCNQLLSGQQEAWFWKFIFFNSLACFIGVWLMN